MQFLVLLSLLLVHPRSQAFTSPSGGASHHCAVRDGGSRLARHQQPRRCRDRRAAPPPAPRRSPPVHPASSANSPTSSSATSFSLWSGTGNDDLLLSSLLFLGWDTTAADASTAATDVSSSLSSSSSWRQYASVAVIGLVLLDIVLGSPVANSVLRNARDSIDKDEVDDDDTTTTRTPGIFNKDNASASGSSTNASSRPRGIRTTGGGPSSSSKPRIDVDAVAKQALEKAEGVTMLREYLDSRKTDWDRMEDLKRKMDQQMAQLDEQQQHRERNNNKE